MGQRGLRKFDFPELGKVENKWQIKKDLFYYLPYLNPGDDDNFVKYTQPVKDYLKNSYDSRWERNSNTTHNQTS